MSALVQKEQMTADLGSIIHLELVFHELIIQDGSCVWHQVYRELKEPGNV